jgi:anti-sigma-K factor RskA
VDELDLFRDLGAPMAPSDDVRRRASARLVAAIERERASSAGFARRFARHRYGVLAFAAALVVASATALFFLAPWASSPGFLERAQAALTPSAGTILHYKWQETRTWTQFSCTVTERPSEIWIDQTYPPKYRALLGHRPASSVEQLVVVVDDGPTSEDPR